MKTIFKIKIKTLFSTIFYMKIIKRIKFHSLSIHFIFFPLVILIKKIKKYSMFTIKQRN